MRARDVVFWVLGSVCICAAVLLSVKGLIPFSDERTGSLVREGIPRLLAGVFAVALIFFYGERGLLRLPRHLMWSVPCFLVALANFPYSALITGSASVERWELLPLFLLKCVGISLLEEGVFRGILYPFLKDRCKGKVLPLLGSAAAFALVHLVNLFFGAGVGATLLQVGYTFLLGCVLAALCERTKSIWLCVFCHFIFDVGGTLIPDLGGGPFQDACFWALTAVCGVLCAVHVVLYLLRRTRSE